jgi:tetratricopeptide (TPR) repeat protein
MLAESLYAFQVRFQLQRNVEVCDSALVLVVALLNRAISYSNIGEFKDSLCDLTSCIAISLHKPELYLLRAESHAHLDDFTNVNLDANCAIDLNPWFVDAHILKGAIEANIGNYAAAIIHLNKAIELDPNYAKAYLVRSFVHSAFRNQDYKNDRKRAFELDGSLGSTDLQE